jgi:hypothetical protein
MTYTAGGLIQAVDYNGFVSTNANANINDVWGAGSGDKGWGQTALATVAATNTVTATQWASLVNTLSSMGSHTGTTLTARTAPTAGNLIQILSNINTDLTNVTTNRNNAVANGSQFTGWTGTNSKTTATGAGAWTITITNTITFASAAAARYFFNAGGRIKIDSAKTSTGATGDPEWNDLASKTGDIWITGAAASKTISGTAYTGVTRIGGSGTPNILATTLGWYNLTTSDQAIFKLFADTAPYTNNFIEYRARTAGTGTQLIITAIWSNPEGDPITGGTAPTGATPGTAPCTIVTYFPPSTTHLPTASWGTPSVAAVLS